MSNPFGNNCPDWTYESAGNPSRMALPQAAADRLNYYARLAYVNDREDGEMGGEGDPGEFTCRKCPSNASCDFAFDLYNVNGGCLAEK